MQYQGQERLRWPAHPAPWGANASRPPPPWRSWGSRQGGIDGDPILERDLVIRRPGTDDRPLATSLRVPHSQPGTWCRGWSCRSLSPADPTVLHVDWDALA